MAITVPYTFVSGTTILSGEVNSNFSTIAAAAANISGTESISGTWTFSANPIFSTAAIIGAASTSGVRLDLESGDLAVREGDDSAYANLKVLALNNTASTITLRGVTYTLPSADGSASQVLQTNGSATLSWETPAAGYDYVQMQSFG